MVTLYLNKEMPVYKPEEIVSGHVEVKLAAKSFTLRVSLNGSANVHWLVFAEIFAKINIVQVFFILIFDSNFKARW